MNDSSEQGPVALPPLHPALAKVATNHRTLQPAHDIQARPRGRPVTHTAESLSRLCMTDSLISAWYEKTFGKPPRSDSEKYTAYCAALAREQGKRTTTVHSQDFKRSLKTLRNVLALARKREHPEKGAFNGTDADAK